MLKRQFGESCCYRFLHAQHTRFAKPRRESRKSFFIDIYFMQRYWCPEGEMKQDQSENLDE